MVFPILAQPAASDRPAAAQRSKKRSRRRRQRGAVFVEALIVSSVLLLFFASTLFLHRMYATQHAVAQDARAAAWAQALEGCDAALDPGDLFTRLVRFGSPVLLEPIPLPEQIGPLQHQTGTAAASVTAPRELGARRFGVDASVQLACNEQIRGERGDLLDVVIYGAQNFLPSFF